MGFGFRVPYQVLLDAELVVDGTRFKMDLVPALERTLHGQVKPSMPHFNDQVQIMHTDFGSDYSVFNTASLRPKE